MSRSVKQPIGQKRLTNVAVVRYKKKGKRFEIACYKNKIINWRNGVEKELDDVLQTTAVFVNVSKGVLAKHEDLVDVFGTDDEEKICIRILNEGDMQISDKERDLGYESLFKDVASVLAEKCVNPETSRPYTISMLERALKDIHFSADPSRNAKQQALEVLPKLKDKILIERARMRLKLQVPSSSGAPAKLRELLAENGAVLEKEETSANGSQSVVVALVDPGCFRNIHNSVQQWTEGAGQTEVVSLAVMEEGEAQSHFDAWGSTHSNPQAAASQQEAAWPSNGGFTPAASTVPQRQAVVGTTGRVAADVVLYERSSVAGLPDEYESRRERFAELDKLQPGWQVELRSRKGNSAVEAIFYSPDAARRAALQAHKQNTT